MFLPGVIQDFNPFRQRPAGGAARVAFAGMLNLIGTNPGPYRPFCSGPKLFSHSTLHQTVPPPAMQILLTNDDGIYAPGLAAMEAELRKFAEVTVVAPITEQSGVGHSITFLQPLTCKKVFDGDRFRGWAVEGSPADCVKLGIAELCPKRPDVVISGINGGLNAGINVLYSGTVAAAIEGLFFGITSIAVSLEYNEHAEFSAASKIFSRIIQQILAQKTDGAQLFNVNIPTQGVSPPAEVLVVPMGVNRYGEHFLKRTDPRGRTYYWATNDPPPQPEGHETDLTALAKGKITLTPLHYNLTRHDLLPHMLDWKLSSTEP